MAADFRDILARLEQISSLASDLADSVRQAAQVAAIDPEMALTRARKGLEIVVRAVYERRVGTPAGTQPLEGLLQRLVKDGHLPRRIAAYANAVRELGNVGTHAVGERITSEDVRKSLAQLLEIFEWYAASENSAPAATVSASAAAEPISRRVPAPRPASRVGLVAGLIVAAPLIAGGIWWMTRPKDSVSNNNGGATEQTANQRAPAPLALNEREQTLPASRVLKVVFQSMPPAPMRPPGPLRLQLGLFGRRGIEKDYRPLTDGDPLASQVDRYFIALRPLTDGYLYVFQVDSQGKADWLFPANAWSSSSGVNPVKSGPTLQIPPGDKESLYLDRNIGIEHLYLVFSATRWPELESALAAPAPPTPSVPPAYVDSPGPQPGRTRGVGGISSDESPPFERITGGNREQLKLTGQTFEASGAFLVIERWFRHVGP